MTTNPTEFATVPASKTTAKKPYVEFLQIWEEGYIKDTVTFLAAQTYGFFIAEGDPLRLPDGRLDRDRIFDFYATWARSVEFTRLRIRRALFGLCPPAWVADERYDPRRHITFGDEVLAATSENFHRFTGRDDGNLSLEHPLWRITVTELDDGRVAIGILLNHVIGDGGWSSTSMADLLTADPILVRPDASDPLADTRPPGNGFELLWLAWRNFVARNPTPSERRKAYRILPFGGRVRRVAARLTRPWRDRRSDTPANRARALPERTADFGSVPATLVTARAEELGATMTELLVASLIKAAGHGVEGRLRFRLPVSHRDRRTLDARNQVTDIPIVGTGDDDMSTLVASVHDQIRSQIASEEWIDLHSSSTGYVTYLPSPPMIRYVSGARVLEVIGLPAATPSDEVSCYGTVFGDRFVATVSTLPHKDAAAITSRVLANVTGAA